MIKLFHSPEMAPGTPHFEFQQISQKCEGYLKAFFCRREIGFPDLPNRAELWDESQRWGSEMAKKYQHVVLVGIGGSSLGVRAIAEVARSQKISFVDNVDAVEFEGLLTNLNLAQTGWIFASKSGTTIETLCALEFTQQVYQDKGIPFFERCFVITENKSSSLHDWARKHGVPWAQVPLDVGGRFSVLSPIGMVPAAFLGLSVPKFRLGAQRALEAQAEITHLMAHSLMSFSRNEWITLLWIYNSNLRSFGAWFVQLWAESLGKKVGRDGSPALRASTPMSAIGAVDQHSILQQVMEGARDKFVIFFRVESSEKGEMRLKRGQFSETKSLEGRTMGELLSAEAQATEEALQSVGVNTISMKVQDLKEESLGFLFMYFQLVVAGLGEAMGLNAFDQPGVELGKRLAKKKLTRT